MSVGTEHPRRLAQARCDSRRRTLAIARFSPKPRNACSAAGGMVTKAAGLFGINPSQPFATIFYHKEFINFGNLVKSMLLDPQPLKELWQLQK
jgi:hypothetical protein